MTNDLISRDDAISVLIRWLSGEGGDIIEQIESLSSAEAENRLYIKIYADDEPSVKAEKLYQICDEEQNREVAEWLKEYFPSAEADISDYCDRLWKIAYERGRQNALDELMEYTYGMLDAEKFGLQHKIKSMTADRKTEQQTEEETLREQCRAFIDIVNQTRRGE